MNVQEMSDNGLKSMHAGMAAALAADDANPTKADPWFGVRETPDWAIQRDDFEAELGARNIPFTHINF